MKLGDLWPNWPDPAGRPTRPFVLARKPIVIIKKIPRLPSTMASSNPLPTPVGQPPDHPPSPAAQPPDDRPGAGLPSSRAQPRDYDDAQREVCRMMVLEVVPIRAERDVDGAWPVFD